MVRRPKQSPRNSEKCAVPSCRENAEFTVWDKHLKMHRALCSRHWLQRQEGS